MTSHRMSTIVLSASLLLAAGPTLANQEHERPDRQPATSTRDAAPYIHPGARSGEAERVPYTGAPGRTRAVPGATNREDVDPLFKRSGESPVVAPQGDGQPANLGPGDAIGRTIPERTHSDRKFP